MLVSFGTCLETHDLPNAKDKLLTAPLGKKTSGKCPCLKGRTGAVVREILPQFLDPCMYKAPALGMHPFLSGPA
jgi:hypothetical protein